MVAKLSVNMGIGKRIRKEWKEKPMIHGHTHTHTHTQVINKTIKIPSLSILFDLEIFMCVTLLLLLTFIPLDIFNIFDAKILKASHITLANNYRICNIWINCNAQPPT